MLIILNNLGIPGDTDVYNTYDRYDWSPQMVNYKAWELVRATVNHPSTLQITGQDVWFLGYSTDESYYHATGSFTAQNSFGATFEYCFDLKFICTDYPSYDYVWESAPHEC